MPIPRLEMENVEAVIPLTVGKDGRVSGLSEYAGVRILVVVPATPPKKARSRGKIEE